jgi:hypothetical protein
MNILLIGNFSILIVWTQGVRQMINYEKWLLEGDKNFNNYKNLLFW